MLSTRDLEEIELSFQNVNSIAIIKAGICTIIGIYIIHSIFNY